MKYTGLKGDQRVSGEGEGQPRSKESWALRLKGRGRELKGPPGGVPGPRGRSTQGQGKVGYKGLPQKVGLCVPSLRSVSLRRPSEDGTWLAAPCLSDPISMASSQREGVPRGRLCS